MREKELRLALICYGGISLAVYMHGISKEIWRLARASRNFHDGIAPPEGSQAIYRELLELIADQNDLKLRVLPDILAGASAGGINAVFLAQAVATGQSLDPLTQLWLEKADVDVLLKPDSRPVVKLGKFWARPVVAALFRRPGSDIFKSASREIRDEIRAKLSRFVKARWFAPPFSGETLSMLLADALAAMKNGPQNTPLLPQYQPIDLMVTATSLWGQETDIQIHSPPHVKEKEHRLNISFRRRRTTGEPIAEAAALVFAARSTASFPGAFPPLQVAEIDQLVNSSQMGWSKREEFLSRIFPGLDESARLNAALIDGSVLTNAPFEPAIEALRNRPAHREIDRRFVYIDPTPQVAEKRLGVTSSPNWFRTIFGALSTIPREQPISDNLERIEKRSMRIAQMRQVIEAIRGDIEADVERVFSHRLFIGWPTAKRLGQWRQIAQNTATQNAGHALSGYVLIKLDGIADEVSHHLATRSGEADIADRIRRVLTAHFAQTGLDRPVSGKRVSEDAIQFLKTHDLDFRIRRLRFVARRFNELTSHNPSRSSQEAINAFHDEVFDCLSLFIELQQNKQAPQDPLYDARAMLENPASCLKHIGQARDLETLDMEVDERLSKVLMPLNKDISRPLLLAYLGFPYFDIATLPMLQGEDLDEFDPVKVDRVSPEDALSIREGGVEATLRGIEFHGFGGFFSRAFRENDYLWGRLHGAERMIDIVASSAEPSGKIDPATLQYFKQAAFRAILDEEEEKLLADPSLIAQIRAEIDAQAAG